MVKRMTVIANDSFLPASSAAASTTAKASSSAPANAAAEAATAETTLAGFESGAIRGIEGVVPRLDPPAIGCRLVTGVARQREIQRLSTRIAILGRRCLLRRERGREAGCDGEENCMENRAEHDQVVVEVGVAMFCGCRNHRMSGRLRSVSDCFCAFPRCQCGVAGARLAA